MASLLACLVGLLIGYFGAIPPGPLNVSVIRKVMRNHTRAAVLVAIGGAAMDTAICVGIGLGIGWVSDFFNERWVKLLLALFLLIYGLKIVFFDRGRDVFDEAGKNGDEKKDDEAKTQPRKFGAVVLGALQGVANPALLVNWTLIIGFLVGHGILGTNTASSVAFAVGVGGGGFGWFMTLIEILRHFRDKPMGRWLRHSTVFAGVILVVFGVYFAIKSLIAG